MIGIIHTGSGNVKSIQRMLERLNTKSIISNSVDELANVSGLILPGVGTFDSGMEVLDKYNLIEFIRHSVSERKVKLLGICLGMQMLADLSEEGNSIGLRLIRGRVKKLVPQPPSIKVPHIGWNYVTQCNQSLLLENFIEPPRFYFTHSYYFQCGNAEDSIATTQHGVTFSSVIQKGKIFGVQFHPEKSHRFGMNLLRNFIEC
jgi:glutamine amidotransferase